MILKWDFILILKAYFRNIILVKTLLNFFLPCFCKHCNIKLEDSSKLLCEDCKPLLNYVSKNNLAESYKKNFSNSYIDELICTFGYIDENPIQALIHSLKYQANFKSADYIVKLIAEYQNNFGINLDIDFIIPIPLHKKKELLRGYNQSLILAKALNKELKIKVDNNILIRKKFTESQTKFNKNERLANVASAFYINDEEKIKGKNILLLDDVITTGATINECAKILKQKKANKIIAFSIAMAFN